jgi:RNA polymerase sigma-70 factor (ECF subfamily)
MLVPALDFADSGGFCGRNTANGGAIPASAAAVARAEAESRARLKRLVEEHHAFVWRSVVRLGVPSSDADDAVQQVFLVLSRRLDDIEPGAERSFLYGVCIRTASHSRRTYARRRETFGEEDAERVDPEPRPDDLLDRARARALLDEILESMPIEQRAVFTLFELEQLTVGEISELLEIPQGTVASRLRKARELFQEGRTRIAARARFRENGGGR